MNLLDLFESVNEGWSDAIVSQRTGKPRTPYSVYIKGKKWKDFENDDHAEAVANKLRAKFKADGRDPSVITIAPTDYDKGMDEAYTPSPAKPFRNPPGFNKQGTGLGNKLADLNRKEWEEKKKKEQGVEEVAPPSAKAERMVKHIKKSLSKDGHLSDKDKAIAYATTWKAHNDGKVEEAQTDYQKRRQRERDVDAGKPVSRQPKNPQTDYARKRAQDKRDMELGEGEREPYQQAIDQLTARRIDDLNMKLDDLVQRAKAEKNPEVKAALAKEFRKHKAERDSYFGIDPATGMNASGTLGTVKGALDEQGAPIKHRVAVTVTDPKHPDMDVMQRTCRVTGPDREKAINSAIAHYRREGFKVHDHHYIGVVDEGSMAGAAHNSKGPKFGGYWKGTNPNPPTSGQGFGGCEEAENPMGQKELDYLIAKAKGTKSKPDPDLHKGDEHEIGYGQELAEKGVDESMGPLGKITKHMAKSSWATSPSTKYELRKRRNPEQMAKRNGIAPVAESKGLSKQVKIVQGPDAGKIGWIREIKLGSYKGAPKTYYIDLEDGGQANNLPGTALRLVKNKMDEGWKSKLAGAALAGAATLGAGGAQAGGVSTTGQGFSMDDQLALNQQMQQRVQQQYDQAQQQKPQAPTSGFSKEYLQKVVSGEHPRPMLSKEKAQELLSQMNESNINESLKRGEYYVWTVYFDDGTSKRIKVPSDEFDPYEYYKKQNKVVVNVDYNWEIQGQ